MKTTKIILFVAIYFLFGFCNRPYAQNSNEQDKRFIERTINGQTYIYDTLRRVIQNKKNHIDSLIKLEPHCDFWVGMIKPYNEIFDKVFSASRKKEIKSVSNLAMYFYCNSSGNVLEVGFLLRNASMLTLQEVNALENEFLKYKFQIRNAACPSNKYYFVMSVYKWD